MVAAYYVQYAVVYIQDRADTASVLKGISWHCQSVAFASSMWATVVSVGFDSYEALSDPRWIGTCK